tara:strand:+ start:172 stop:354 length:183 start_codon:yes stop_codon:yes gene_type:complete
MNNIDRAFMIIFAFLVSLLGSLLIYFMVSEQLNTKIALENGYEQVMVKGYNKPVWQKPNR